MFAPGITRRSARAVSVAVGWGCGRFHGLGLGGLSGTAVTLAHIHREFTLVFVARLKPYSFGFSRCLPACLPASPVIHCL